VGNLKELISLGFPVITIIVFLVNLKNNGTKNKELISQNKEYVDGKLLSVDKKLEKKDARIKVLENEKIKLTEALNRTYMTNEDAYNIFVQNKDYEKDMKILNKSIEAGIKENTNSNNKTHSYLIELLNQNRN